MILLCREPIVGKTDVRFALIFRVRIEMDFFQMRVYLSREIRIHWSLNA